MPNTTIYGKCEIGEANFIGPNTMIINSVIGNDNNIVCSYIKNSVVSNNKTIGPYAEMEDESLC